MNQRRINQVGKFAEELAKESTDNMELQLVVMSIVFKAVEWADSHPAWVSVEEELPKERGHYLAYTEYGQVWLTEYMQDKGGYWDWFVAPICVGVVSKVTHWMPLPIPPAEKGGQDETAK